MKPLVLSLYVVPLFIGLALFALVIRRPVLYTNFTASMPEGIYLRVPGPARPGEDVIFPVSAVSTYGLHIPARMLLKRYAYPAGTRIRISAVGLSVAGSLVARRVVRIGVSYHGVVARGEAIVLGESPRSFGSRYFGPVPLGDLHPVSPLLTWVGK